MKEKLLEGLNLIDVNLNDELINQLISYAQLLIDYNKHTNLTAIRDEDELIEKHLLDSLLVHKVLNKRDGRAIDIGTGAGFPGMVLAICNPKINFTLVDSVGKKTKFLQMVVNNLNLDNVAVRNTRAEELIKEPNQRESYDFGFCRGVSKLNVILEYMLPFLNVGGVFFPQKMECGNEIDLAENALKTLNSKIVRVIEDNLPFTKDDRFILEILKYDRIDEKYPRRVGIPLKKPL